MELIEILKVLQLFIDQNDILYIFYGGSYAWKSNMSHDKDIIVIVKEDFDIHSKKAQIAAFKYNNEDIFIKTYNYWRDKSYHYYLDNVLLNKYPENLLYGSLVTENFNIKTEAYNSLERFYQNGFKPCLRYADPNSEYCLKSMYWGLMLFYANDNNYYLDFSLEQWDTIQKCHDRQLPISYRDELKANIEKTLMKNGSNIKKSKTKN